MNDKLKKKNWATLSDLKAYLEQETQEKIIQFTGWYLDTETTRYTIAHGKLYEDLPKNIVKPEPKPKLTRPSREEKPKNPEKIKQIAMPPNNKKMLAAMKAKGKQSLDAKKAKKVKKAKKRS